MAGTTSSSKRTSHKESDVASVLVNHNLLIDDVEVIRAVVAESDIAVEEIIDDHASIIASIASLKTLADELKADYNLLRGNYINGCFSTAGLAEGTNANTIKTVTTAQFAIGGQLYSKAATDNIAMTAATAQSISTFRLYLVSSDSGGNITITAGTEVGTDTAVLPALPASSAPIGAFKVATNGSTTFTSGTTDLSAAGLTVTYYNLSFANSGTSANTAIAAADATAGPATLTAAKPTSANVNAASDLLAAKVGNIAGTAITSSTV